MSGFRPLFWPTAISVPLLLVLLGLGTWQLERLQWKEGLIAARAAAIAAPPIAVPRDLAAARGMEFRHVAATGSFLNDKEIFLGATDEGGETGFHLLTPLRLDDGALLLVDRGWLPGNRKDPATRAAGQLSATVTVEGLLRIGPAQRPNWFVPDNDCARNYWFWVEGSAIARCFGLDHLLPVYMDAGPAPNPGGFPKGGITRTALPNDHLSYAITWFALAAGLVVVYVVFHLQQRRE
ncbi:MAG: SURF1-like protein [Rhodospirillales bacterium]|nr:SURF1-like protein [Rhodospirillales bacterium]